MNQGIHAIDTMCWLAGDVKVIWNCRGHVKGY